MTIWTKLRNGLYPKKLSEEELINSDSFCIMPWVHFHVTQQGTVTPCCNAPWEAEHAFGNINRHSLNEIWTGRAMRKFRQTMRQGEKDYRCTRCYDKEASNWLSLRKITNEKYRHHFNLVHQDVNAGQKVNMLPVYLDIRFSNVCNLKCRICGPWSSSSWFEDAVALGWQSEGEQALTCSVDHIDGLLQQIMPLIGHLEEIYFAGGEPLVMEGHYQLLHLLIQSKRTDVQLSYNTNFTNLNFKGESILDLWSQFDKVNLALSLDGQGARAEYMRAPCKWHVIEYNFAALRQHCPHAEVIISSTISVLNLLHLPDFHRTWVEQGKINVEDCVPTMLIKPQHLNIRILPVELKERARRLYQNHITWMDRQAVGRRDKFDHAIQQFKNVIPYLYSSHESAQMPTFREQMRLLDGIRGENALRVFPELSSLITFPKGKLE